MTTPEQARKLAEWSENNENLPAKVRDALLDLARQVEELQADAERYRYMKANAVDCHMWNDESIDSARNAK